MQAKTTRVAYLNRMLRRLDAERLRLQELVRANELSSGGADLGTMQLDAHRNEILSELRHLEQGAFGEFLEQPPK